MRALIILLGLACIATVTASAIPEPNQSPIDPAAVEAARQEALNAPLRDPSEWEYPPVRDESLLDRLGNDFDTSHYARGRTLILHIFINDPSHTWTDAERGTSGARSNVAKDYYMNRHPWGANMSFDDPATYWWYNPTINWVVPDDPTQQTTNQACEDACAALGYIDQNGNGSRMDDLTLAFQNWNGGWDNVILVFQPHVNGRAYGDFYISRCVLYMNDDGSVWAHEWGHDYQACDEYVEEGHCWNCDCGPCTEGFYLENTEDNGNCALPACPLNNNCVMKYNTINVAPCVYTQQQWSWRDSDSDGWLDRVKRPTGPGTYCWIYEAMHNGWFVWNGVNDGVVFAQRWTSWYAAGIRSPGTADYDLVLYGDNNHNFQYASSAYGTGAVDFVVGDCNHSPIGNEHLAISHYSGDWANYALSWESGEEMLFADGLYREEWWWSGHVVRVWDVPLQGGEQIGFSVTNPSGTLDLGMALFASNGQPYWAGRPGAAWSRDATGIGGNEYYTYTVPNDDVYGLVVWSNNAADGTIGVQLGPARQTMAEATVYTSPDPLSLYCYDPYTPYWAFIGNRSPAGTQMRLGLYGDENYQQLLSSVWWQEGLQFFAADYNDGYDRDYPRNTRTSGAGSYQSEWEQGANIHAGIEQTWWTSPHLGKMWDANLTAGTQYFLRQYHDPAGSLDTGIFFFSSADGLRFKNFTQASASSNWRPPSEGGEWCSFTPTVSDWYGICQVANNEASASTSLWLGPRYTFVQGGAGPLPDRVVWGIEPVSSIYWSVFAARAQLGETAVVQMFADDACSSTYYLGGGEARQVSFVVGDFNHNPTGNVYSRTYRDTGYGAVTHQWEGGTDQLGFNPGSEWIGYYTWPAGNVAKMWDLFMSAGTNALVEVTALSGQMDFGLEVFSSYGYSLFWAGRSGGTYSDMNGMGGSESLSIPFAGTDWYGVLVWNNNEAGGNYRIRIVDLGSADVAETIPTTFDLRAVSSNPFRESATLVCSFPGEGPAQVAIYDVRGGLVRTLVRNARGPGSFTLQWDGRDDAGATMGSGVYFARVRQGGEQKQVKLVRLP